MTEQQPVRPSVKDLVAECLERLETEGGGALEALCAEHPEHAASLRRRVGALAAAGLLDEASDARPPERIAGFKLLRPLGGGGMGVVYLAEQLDLGRQVALKLVRPELLYFDGARQRFTREVEAVARLQHPGIVPVHAAGEDQGVPYLAMERVPGVTLAQAIAVLADRAPAHLAGADLRRAVLSVMTSCGEGVDPGSSATGRREHESWPRAVARLGVQAADALQHAHERGVLHRDVKPSNLMITPAGHVLLVDFGLALADGDARITSTGSHLGSLAYMAPEQVRGSKQIDARTDVYGLGATLFELLSLRPPFPTESHELLRQRILEGRPPALRTINPGVSLELATVVATAMDPEPARRYASTAALRDDLLAVLEHQPIRARPPGPWLRLRRWVQRRPAAATAAALGTLLLVGAPLTWAFAQREANRRTEIALVRANAHLADAQRAVEVIADVAREKLEFVPGMGPVREDLLLQALEFSQRISEREGDTPDVIETTARAAYRVGLIQMELGDYSSALPAMQSAVARAQLLLDVDPAHPAGLDLAARATVELGSLADLSGEPERAKQHRADAQRLFERWYELTEDPEAQAGLSRLHYRESVFSMDRGFTQAAWAASSRSVELSDELLVQQPNDLGQLRQLGMALTVQGQALRKLGHASESLAPLQRALELQDALREQHPDDIFLAHAGGMTHIYLGITLDTLTRYEDAEAHFLSAFDRFEWLNERTPDAPMMRAPLFSAHSSFAAMQARRGNTRSAVEHFAEALRVLDAELARPEPLPRFVGDRGLVLLALGILLRDNNEHDQARKVLTEAIATQRRALAHDPDNASWNAALASQLRTRGLVELETQNWAACADNARAIHAHVGDDQELRRVALGLLARASQGVADPELRAAWLDECFVWLTQMLDAGWAQPDLLTGDFALEGLRGDPRFQAAVQRLQTTSP